jgi:hypothetical protein
MQMHTKKRCPKPRKHRVLKSDDVCIEAVEKNRESQEQGNPEEVLVKELTAY